MRKIHTDAVYHKDTPLRVDLAREERGLLVELLAGELAGLGLEGDELHAENGNADHGEEKGGDGEDELGVQRHNST